MAREIYDAYLAGAVSPRGIHHLMLTGVLTQTSDTVVINLF